MELFTQTTATQPYQPPPAKQPGTLVLDGTRSPLNHPLLGVAARALADLARQPERLSDYPDTDSLAAAIARVWDIAPDRVLLTAGGDDALIRICRAFLGPNRNLITWTPTFELLISIATTTGTNIQSFKWLENDLPVDNLWKTLSDQTGLVAITSPNNPTGAMVSRTTLEGLLKRIPSKTPVLLDAVYADFAAWDPTRLALWFPNVMVVRSFSKAWSLPGLRIGYVLGSEPWLTLLRAQGSPYAVSTPAIATTLEVLRVGTEVVRVSVENVCAIRHRLITFLRDQGFPVPDSSGNFAYVPMQDSRPLARALAVQGVAVRSFGNALRITTPNTDEDLQQFKTSLINAQRDIS